MNFPGSQVMMSEKHREKMQKKVEKEMAKVASHHSLVVCPVLTQIALLHLHDAVSSTDAAFATTRRWSRMPRSSTMTTPSTRSQQVFLIIVFARFDVSSTDRAHDRAREGETGEVNPAISQRTRYAMPGAKTARGANRENMKTEKRKAASPSFALLLLASSPHAPSYDAFAVMRWTVLTEIRCYQEVRYVHALMEKTQERKKEDERLYEKRLIKELQVSTTRPLPRTNLSLLRTQIQKTSTLSFRDSTRMCGPDVCTVSGNTCTAIPPLVLTLVVSGL